MNVRRLPQSGRIDNGMVELGLNWILWAEFHLLKLDISAAQSGNWKAKLSLETDDGKQTETKNVKRHNRC